MILKSTEVNISTRKNRSSWNRSGTEPLRQTWVLP